MQIYGWQHLVYLGIVITLMITGYLYIYKHVKTQEKMTKIIKILAVILFILILSNRISVLAMGDEPLKHFLPESYCGISAFAISISILTLRKDHPFLHAVSFIGFLGGLLTMIYPDFLVQDPSFFYLPTITGLLHHSLMLFLVVLMIGSGYIKPTLKKYHLLVIGIMGYITLGAIMIYKLDYEHAMYITAPAIEGTMFDFVGLGYFLFPVHAIYLFLWDKYNDKLHLMKFNETV